MQVAFHYSIVDGSSSTSSSEELCLIQDQPIVEEGSDLDSMPELEDEIDLDEIDIPELLLSSGVMVTFGGVIFEREQGPPWEEILSQMLEEHDLMEGST